MADVALSEAKEIKKNLLEWDSSDNPLAPLSASQRDTVLELLQETSQRPVPSNVSIKVGHYLQLKLRPLILLIVYTFQILNERNKPKQKSETFVPENILENIPTSFQNLELGEIKIETGHQVE
jgi:hypothetical protein